jgi:hypothetical protein
LRHKNIENHAYLGSPSKFCKIKKVEFQNTRTALTSFGIHEICQKSGHGVEWVKFFFDTPTQKHEIFFFCQLWSRVPE